MKTLSRTDLPEFIQQHGQKYTLNRMITDAMERNGTTLGHISNELKKEGRKAILVNVLSKNLRGKLDIHNKPYKPTRWIFTT